MFKPSLMILVCAAAFYCPAAIQAQQITQTVRGTVTDQTSGQALTGVMVLVESVNPLLGTSTDSDGVFRIDLVPVGKHALRLKYTGYKDLTVSSLTVGSGKEIVLLLQMEEDVAMMKAVEIVAEPDKKEAINSMSSVSSRTFSVEETQKFAAAISDPGRMAVSFAGVVSPDDGGNTISVRGNSPYGLLWRMEGVDIPNPNHFANAATSGGGISILSAQTLANSDFITGAFAAEYGNALAGVFDLRLRKGNNEKREYTIQAGLLGIDIAAEGPVSQGSGGSFLVNYRYSTLSVLANLGLEVGDAITNFQDISFNVSLPTKRQGTFQLFGFGGLSSSKEDALRDTSAWEYSWQRYDQIFFSNTGAAGIKHMFRFSEQTYMQSSLMISGNDYGYHVDRLDERFISKRIYDESFVTSKITLTSVLNHKFNARHSLRTGAYVNRFGFSLLQQILENNTDEMQTQIDASGAANTVQAFAQWKYRITNDLTINGGVHWLYMPENSSSSIEPRLAARYALNPHQTLSVGYGLHSQMQPIGVYKAQILGTDGNYQRPNETLGFNKAHHFVIGYQRSLSKYLYVKSELYYQRLFHVAVGAQSGSTLSTLNNNENYITEMLVNSGLGRNMGVELTVEQFTHKDLYFLISGSLYDSKYRANDGVWRNTRYNGNYATSLTAGKEWSIGKSKRLRTAGINIRLLFAGGLRETPVDEAASIAEGYTRRQDDRAFETRNPYYFRSDIRLSLRRNRPHATTTLALDVQNVTNRKNVFGTWFDIESGQTRMSYQLPLIPILSYRIDF